MFGAGVKIGEDTELGKELAKWNKPFDPSAVYPRMLYKARRRPDGVVRAAETDDGFFRGPDGKDKPGAAEDWTRANQRIVKNEDEHLKAKGQGWRDTMSEAVEFFNSEYAEVGTVAAHRNFEDRNMSEKAKAEAAKLEGDGPEHVPEIPEQPKQRRGWPKGKPRARKAEVEA